ncbi:regulator of chromosome condensation 1/beta-lactamase-inhibitor protein II [Gorgonomyces haynaldii]|nr:regulator of chromosome condensation 1/beta-lactamase-inhibitor protein II [Gorgonomyces haynaldii]
MSTFGFGSNALGQLGVSGEDRTTPTWVADGFDQVCGGANHTLLLKQGRVYGCGSNQEGQLSGLQKEGIHPLGIENVQFIFCLWNLSFAAAQECVYYCGSSSLMSAIGWTKIPIPNVIKICGGLKHLLLLQADGTIHALGNNRHGQLLVASPVDSNMCPPTLLMKVDQTSMGSEHCLALFQNKCYSWGWNEHGMCGLGTISIVAKPSVIQESVKSIGTGNGHSFIVC